MYSFSDRKSNSASATKQAITVSKSEFWYGTPTRDENVEPKHSITDSNIHVRPRPKSALVPQHDYSNKYAKIEGYKAPVVELGLVKQRAKVSKTRLKELRSLTTRIKMIKMISKLIQNDF